MSRSTSMFLFYGRVGDNFIFTPSNMCSHRSLIQVSSQVSVNTQSTSVCLSLLCSPRMCKRNPERENKEDCVREEDRWKVQRWVGGV